MKKGEICLLIISLCIILMSIPLKAQEEKKNDSPVKPALLVIDIQNEYLKYMSEEDKKFAMDYINGAIWTYHQNKIPVIRVYHTDLNSGPKPGTEPFEYPKSVIVNEDDPKIIKNYPNAFNKTDLGKILKEKGCNTLFLCGLSATGCVLATYFGAIDGDYKVFMLKEAIISPNSTYTNMIKDICESVNYDSMKFILDKLVKK
jgi:nicotinamidase-related amidase